MTDQRAALKALMLQKDAIEKEILDISEALTADNLGGATGALVDGEGYPRADVERLAVRWAERWRPTDVSGRRSAHPVHRSEVELALATCSDGFG